MNDDAEVGRLVRELSESVKELDALTIEGNRLAGSLLAIADWFQSLNDSEESREFKFTQTSDPGISFRVTGHQGDRKFPSNLEEHIRRVLELQKRIDDCKETLRDLLGIDHYAKYLISINDPS